VLTAALITTAMVTLVLSTAFGLPPANTGTDNARESQHGHNIRRKCIR